MERMNKLNPEEFLKMYAPETYKMWNNFLSKNETIDEFMKRFSRHNFNYSLYVNNNYKQIDCCLNCRNNIEYGTPDGSYSLCCNLDNTFEWNDIDYSWNGELKYNDDEYIKFEHWLCDHEIKSNYICDAHEFKNKV